MNDKHRKSYLGHILAVRWLDAWWDQDPTSNKDWKLSNPVVTYGLCVRDVPGKLISVTHEHDHNGDEHHGVTHIPWGIIEKVDDYGIATDA